MGLEIPELYFNLGLAYEKRNDNKMAIDFFRKFIELVEKEDIIKPSLREDLDAVRAHLQEL